MSPAPRIILSADGNESTGEMLVSNGDAPVDRREQFYELGVATAVIVLGLVVLWQTRDIRISPMNAKIGPRVIPYIVGSGLVVVGIWFAVDVLRGNVMAATGADDAEDVDVDATTDWRTVAAIAVSLGAYLALLERAGFIAASSLLFFGAAAGMGSRRFVRDAAVAVALSVAVYVLFTRGLSLRLPEGIVPLLVSQSGA